ncbi:hypothetical protein HYW36_01155 [Candidatus Saccharibacteria bacterium]|nr:hypothetical protein [Candidatus Saccharibacteria bacterium]
MKVIVLYRPNSEQESAVADFVRDYERFKNKKLELMSLEKIEGADMARLYDITRYPAFLAIANNGTLQRMWQGLPMPLMDELAYYTQDQDPHDYTNAAINHHLRILQPLAI